VCSVRPDDVLVRRAAVNTGTNARIIHHILERRLSSRTRLNATYGSQHTARQRINTDRFTVYTQRNGIESGMKEHTGPPMWHSVTRRIICVVKKTTFSEAYYWTLHSVTNWSGEVSVCLYHTGWSFCYVIKQACDGEITHQTLRYYRGLNTLLLPLLLLLSEGCVGDSQTRGSMNDVYCGAKQIAYLLNKRLMIWIYRPQPCSTATGNCSFNRELWLTGYDLHSGTWWLDHGCRNWKRWTS